MLQYVDHAIIGVADLEASARDYGRLLGFSVSAGGVHPGAGTRNRLIVLDPEYIELIARVPGADAGGFSPVWSMLERGPGAIGLALASDDIDSDVEAMRARGLNVDGPHAGRLDRPDGSARGWRAARIAGECPGIEARCLPFIIQHDASGTERLRRIAAPDGPRVQPNGAQSLAYITVAVRDLAAGLRVFNLAFALEPEQPTEDSRLNAVTARLPLTRGAIVLAAPLPGDGQIAHALDAHGEGLFSVTICVTDLATCVRILRERGVEVSESERPGALTVVRPELSATHGGLLDFVAC